MANSRSDREYHSTIPGPVPSRRRCVSIKRGHSDGCRNRVCYIAPSPITLHTGHRPESAPKREDASKTQIVLYKGPGSLDKLSCETCNLRGVSNKKLLDHLKSHQKHPKLVCCRCETVIISTASAGTHFRSCAEPNHTAKVEYPCDECERVFSSKSGRKIHTKSAHPKSYQRLLPSEKRVVYSDTDMLLVVKVEAGIIKKAGRVPYPIKRLILGELLADIIKVERTESNEEDRKIHGAVA